MCNPAVCVDSEKNNSQPSTGGALLLDVGPEKKKNTVHEKRGGRGGFEGDGGLPVTRFQLRILSISFSWASCQESVRVSLREGPETPKSGVESAVLVVRRVFGHEWLLLQESIWAWIVSKGVRLEPFPPPCNTA